MSLKVWLPLMGNLNNQGVSNIKIENMGAVVANSAGKIGQCMSFTGAETSYLRLPPILSNTECSIAFWAKLNTSSTAHAFYSQRVTNNATGFTIFQLTNGNLRFDDGAGFEVAGIGTGAWHHVVCCRDATKKYIYVDGVLRNSTTKGNANPNVNYALIGGSQNNAAGTPSQGTTNALNGYLNDYRIYDHCLSAAEVREISQGLVLHYKLDTLDIQSGTNLVTGVTAGGRTTVLTDGRVGVQTTGVNQDTYFTINLSENIVAGTSYLFTCDASGISNGQYWGFPLGAQGNSGVLPFKIYNGHNVYLFTANSTKSDGTTMDWGTKRLFMDDNYRGDWANQACFYNFQLIKIGASDTIIKTEDSSGYNHNGTIVNTLSLVNSQARYTSNIHFSANNQHIQLPAITYSNFGNSFAIAWWGKRSTHSGMMFWGFSDGNRLNGLYNGTLWNTGDGSNNPIYKPGTTTTITAPTATSWHHYVMVGNGTKSQLYVDGVLYGEAKTYKGLTGTSIWINGWRNHTEYSSADMDISDFRIYCTALNAAAIKQLYEVGAKVDNKNNVHSFELNENGQNKVTKSGQLQCSTFTEFNGMSFLKYDSNLYIEPDGSCWVRVYHHNNPGAGVFSSSNDFQHSVYIDENRWFNVEVANYLNKWEIMFKGKYTSSGEEWKIRWIQQYNPMTATYANVAAANITKITDGYGTTPSGYGGLYKRTYSNGNNTYLCANNGTESNWYGAVGSWTVYQSGIPGWFSGTATVTTTGYNDMYLRIDNVTFTSPTAKSTKNNIWTGKQIIEL